MGQMDKADSSLKWLRGSSYNASLELAEIEMVLKKESSEKKLFNIAALSSFANLEVLKPFVLLSVLFAIQVISKWMVR